MLESVHHATMRYRAHIVASCFVAVSVAFPAVPADAASGGSKPAQPPAPPPPAAAVEQKPAPYDGQLNRLAEVLGSVSYLRTLCGGQGEDWRGTMRKFLDADTLNEPKRREILTAAYNRGYRAFAAVHTSCTDTARFAEERYRNEGATLAAEIAARYGN